MTNLVLVRDNPWERMDSETDAAFHAFQHYRDLGPERSIEAAVAQHRDGCGTGGGRGRADPKGWEKWSSRYEWVDRCAAWEAHLDTKRIESFEEVAVEMGRRHAEQASAALMVLSAPAKALAKMLAEGSDVMENFATLAKTDPTAFLAMVDLVKASSQALPALAKMEREARGLGDGEEGAGVQEVRVVVKVDENFRL